MARKKAKDEEIVNQVPEPITDTSVATMDPPGDELPLSDTNGNAPVEAPAPAANGHGGGEAKQKPVESFSVVVSKDTYIRASVWPREVVLKGGEVFTTHEVNLSKRYKDGKGEWQTMHSFRGSELYAVAHVLRRAEAFILDLRTQTQK